MVVNTQDTNKYNDIISSWVYPNKRGIVKIDSIKKDYKLESSELRNQDANEIDYSTRIKNGWYDSGVAIRCGWGIGHEHFAVGVDLDGKDAVKAFFGGESDEETWERVERYAQNNLVEWHKDRTSLHLIIYLKEEIESIKITLPQHTKEDRRQIEIQCEGKLLCVSPSMNKDGHRWTALDSEIIPILDGIQLLGLKAKIHGIRREHNSQDYLNEHENQRISDWLHDTKTIFGEGQGRHNWTVWIVNSYFWKYGNGWLELTDDERFSRAWQWTIDHCKPNRSKQEFDKICNDVKSKYRQQRDTFHEEKRDEKRKDFNDMPNCISYQTNSNPDRFIASTPSNTVVEVEHKYVADKGGHLTTQQHTIKTFTPNKPARIIKHKNPLSFLDLRDKYTIEFIGSEPSGCFTTKHKSIAEIVAELNDGNTLTDRGLDIMLNAQIRGFEKAGKLEISDSIDYTGFFPSGKKIISSNVKILDDYPSVSEVSDALDYIEELATKYYVGREDLLSHICKWFMIAPFAFLFKVVGAPYLDWMHPHGNPNTGKTTSGEIGLGFDGNDSDEHKLNMRHIDTIARFGDTVSNTTFPKIINEVDLRERDDIITNIITAVDAIKFRKTLDRNRHAEHVPSLTPLFLTGNPTAPTKPEYLKRVKTRFSTASEVHLPDSHEAKEHKSWLAINSKRSRVLGQFRNKFVMSSEENQALILDTQLTGFEKSIKIWTAIYEYCGRKLPQFFKKRLEQHQMEESLEDKKSDISIALQSWIVDKCKQLDTNSGTRYDNQGHEIGDKKILDQYTANTDRLSELIKRNLTTDVKRDNKGRIVFFRQVAIDLEKYGLKDVDLHSIGDSIPNARYGKFSDGYKVVKCSMSDLITFFMEGTSQDD
jgi:hypothetical protein